MGQGANSTTPRVSCTRGNGYNDVVCSQVFAGVAMMGEIVRRGTFGRKENNLFSGGANCDLNACVGRNGGPADFGRYAQGYFEAGERLVRSLRRDHYGIDGLIYPLVMIYRHGVEAMLKQLAVMSSVLVEKKREVHFTHKLTDNWAVLRRCLPQLDVPQQDIDGADAIIEDLIEIDPNGESFRYPISGKGNLHLEDWSLINVSVFSKGMTRLTDFLNNCYWYLADMSYARADIEHAIDFECGW